MALKLGEAFALIGLKTTHFTKGLAGVRAKFGTAMGKMQAMAGRFSSMLGVALGAGMFGMMIKSAATFEQGMNRVKALTGSSGDEMDALTAKAKELGRTTMYTARQSADAMSYFALAGFDANKIMAAMGPTLDLAAAGQMDVAQAADIVAKIMAGMGLDTDELTHAVDVLAKAFTSANTDLNMLGEAMKYVGPVAKTAGVSLEDVTALIMALSNAGIGGAMAGTTLRRAISALAGGSKPAVDAMRALGVQTTTASGQLRPIVDIIGDMSDAMRDMGEAQKVAILMQAFGQRAGPGMAELLSLGRDSLIELRSRLEDVGGTAERIATVQMEGLAGETTKLRSAIEALGLAFADPLLVYLVQATKALKDWTSGTAEAEEGTDRLEKKVGVLADTLEVMGRMIQSAWAMIRVSFAATTKALTLQLQLLLRVLEAIVARSKQGILRDVLGKQNIEGAEKKLRDLRHALQDFSAEADQAARDSVKAMTEGWLEPSPSQKAENARRESKAKAVGEQEEKERAEKKAEEKARTKKRQAFPGVGEIAAKEPTMPGTGVNPALEWLRAQAGRKAQIAAEEARAPKVEPGIARWELERALRARRERRQALETERWMTAEAMRQIPAMQEGVRAEEERARRTPEFSAIADFAKSVQSRVYDKRRVNLAKNQLKVLEQQKAILETRLKSIDDQLKEGMVARAG